MQFAETLHVLRYQLAGLSDLTPVSAGTLLATNAFDTSTRFQEFLQQHAGRIVVALLPARMAAASRFTPALSRIVTDLERERIAREWLKDARRTVADRLKGAGRGPGPHGPRSTIPSQCHLLRSRPGRPHLVLRPSGKDAWSVLLEFPNFRDLARLDFEFNTYLKTTRCRVAGAGGIWLPADGSTATGLKRVLKTWPAEDETLLSFERPNRKVQHILETECRLSPGPVWAAESKQTASRAKSQDARSGPASNMCFSASNQCLFIPN